MTFIARVTQSSPPVPATITRNKKKNSRTVRPLRGAWWSAADHKYADANHSDAGPTQWRNNFLQEEVTQRGNDSVRESGGRLYVAIVRPGKHEHVGDKKREETGDTEPDVAGSQNLEENTEKVRRSPILGRTNPFHPFAQQNISQRSE